MLFLLLGGAAVADFMTTAYAVGWLGVTVEQNLLYSFMYTNLGMVGLAIPKFATAGLWFTRNQRFGMLCVGFAIGMQTFAAALNLGQILWLRALLS